MKPQRFGKARRPREIPPADPPKPTTSWWLCKPEDFYREAHKRFPEMSVTRFGKMALTTDERGMFR